MSAGIIALGAFIFVSLTVGGFRLINALDALKAKAEAERRRAVTSRANRNDYHGPLYSQRGSEIGE